MIGGNFKAIYSGIWFIKCLMDSFFLAEPMIDMGTTDSFYQTLKQKQFILPFCLSYLLIFLITFSGLML